MGAAAIPAITAASSAVGAAGTVYGVAKSGSDKAKAANAAALAGRGGASGGMMPAGGSGARFNDLLGGAFKSGAEKNAEQQVAGVLSGSGPSLTGTMPREATGVDLRMPKTSGPTIGPLPIPSAASERGVNMLQPPTAGMEKSTLPGYGRPQNTFASPTSASPPAKSSFDLDRAIGKAGDMAGTVSSMKDLAFGGMDDAAARTMEEVARNKGASSFAYDPNRKQRLMDLLAGVIR